jgi:dihydrofolate reductase
MPFADRLYLTIVHKDFDADIFYSEIDYSQWEEVAREDIKAVESLGFDYSYITYDRKK